MFDDNEELMQRSDHVLVVRTLFLFIFVYFMKTLLE